MDGQLNLFEYIDDERGFSYCTTCENCKHTDLFKDYVDRNGESHFLAFCNQTRSVITDKTGSWLCKNENYKRRTR